MNGVFILLHSLSVHYVQDYYCTAVCVSAVYTVKIVLQVVSMLCIKLIVLLKLVTEGYLQRLKCTVFCVSEVCAVAIFYFVLFQRSINRVIIVLPCVSVRFCTL